MYNIYNHTAGDRTPYTYLLGWTEYNKWYYGSQYGEECHPNNLWNSYFTSSKVVYRFREIYGDPDIIQIRKIFNDRNKARIFEGKVLQRLKVRTDNKWLNITESPGIDSYGMLMWYKGDECTKSVLSPGPDWKRGVPLSKRSYGQTPWNKGLTKETDKRIMNYSLIMSGRKITWSDKMRKPKSNTVNMGKYERSHEIREKLSKINTGLIKPKQPCQFCGDNKQTGMQIIKHEDKCGLNPKNHKFCKICGKLIKKSKNRKLETCSNSCGSKLGRLRRLPPDNSS